MFVEVRCNGYWWQFECVGESSTAFLKFCAGKSLADGVSHNTRSHGNL